MISSSPMLIKIRPTSNPSFFDAPSVYRVHPWIPPCRCESSNSFLWMTCFYISQYFKNKICQRLPFDVGMWKIVDIMFPNSISHFSRNLDVSGFSTISLIGQFVNTSIQCAWNYRLKHRVMQMTVSTSVSRIGQLVFGPCRARLKKQTDVCFPSLSTTSTEKRALFDAERYACTVLPQMGLACVGSLCKASLICWSILSTIGFHWKLLFSMHPFRVWKIGMAFSADLEIRQLKVVSLPFNT